MLKGISGVARTSRQTLKCKQDSVILMNVGKTLPRIVSVSTMARCCFSPVCEFWLSLVYMKEEVVGKLTFGTKYLDTRCGSGQVWSNVNVSVVVRAERTHQWPSHQAGRLRDQAAGASF